MLPRSKWFPLDVANGFVMALSDVQLGLGLALGHQGVVRLESVCESEALLAKADNIKPLPLIIIRRKNGFDSNRKEAQMQ